MEISIKRLELVLDVHKFWSVGEKKTKKILDEINFRLVWSNKKSNHKSLDISSYHVNLKNVENNMKYLANQKIFGWIKTKRTWIYVIDDWLENNR